MASDAGTIRDEVYTRILVSKAAEWFNFNDFGTEKTWLPHSTLPELTTDYPNGKVYVIGGAPEDIVIASKTGTNVKEQRVMVGYQRAAVDHQDQALIDDLVELVEMLDHLCLTKVDQDLFTPVRLEYLKDENEVPFAFMGLRDGNVFEAYFTAVYKFVRGPNHYL